MCHLVSNLLLLYVTFICYFRDSSTQYSSLLDVIMHSTEMGPTQVCNCDFIEGFCTTW